MAKVARLSRRTIFLRSFPDVWLWGAALTTLALALTWGFTSLMGRVIALEGEMSSVAYGTQARVFRLERESRDRVRRERQERRELRTVGER